MKPNPVTKNCIICGKPFTDRASRMAVLKTCRSPDCRKAMRAKNIENVYKHNPDRTPWNKKKRNCVTVECGCGCGTVFEIPRYRLAHTSTGKFFVNSAHYREWLHGPNHWNFRGGPFPYGPAWPKIADEVRARQKVCQMCGKTPQENGRELDVHHIVPFRISHDNGAGNLVALCMTCHRRITHLDEIEYAPYYAIPSTCVVCGREFFPDTPRARSFCSPECAHERQLEYGRRGDNKRKAQKVEYARQWRKRNRAHVNAYARARKARLKAQRPPTPPKARGGGNHRGEHNGRAILTPAQVLEMRTMYDGKRGSIQRLANMFGVSHSAASDAIHGKHWKHLTDPSQTP